MIKETIENENRKEGMVIPTMLTINEVSDRTGISRDAIRKMVLSGELAHIKVGKKYLVNFNRFVEFLNGGAAG